MSLTLRPITLKEAKEYIATHHRHHKPPVGWKFGVAVEEDGVIVGVAVAGRPVARMIDQERVLEVTRVATDGSKNACSMLYGAMRRAAKALGYDRLITYTLESEPGASLRASGWQMIRKTEGGRWSCPSRPRNDDHPTEPKFLWEATL
jgi:antitoxin (DNA-binding transcriptional repressor) of toxin-antitoxin stability system